MFSSSKQLLDRLHEYSLAHYIFLHFIASVNVNNTH